MWGRSSSIASNKPKTGNKVAKKKDDIPRSYDNTKTATPTPRTVRTNINKVESSSAAQPIAPEDFKDAPAKIKAAKIVGADYQLYGLYQIKLMKPDNQGWGVQVASLANYENLLKTIADYQAKWYDNIFVKIEKGTITTSTYKIILGQFDTEAKAKAYKKSLETKKGMKGCFVVSFEEEKTVRIVNNE